MAKQMGTVGRKKRTGILKYHKHKSKGCGYISYPTQPEGRRPVEYLPGAYESGGMLEAYNKSMAHWLADSDSWIALVCQPLCPEIS